MSIDEKAGQMFISGAGINPDGSIGKKRRNGTSESCC